MLVRAVLLKGTGHSPSAHRALFGRSYRPSRLVYQLGEVYQELSVALDVKETRPKLVGSGGALLSSSTLRQIVSDTLGTPLYPSYELEASARGVALLALAALGFLPDVGQVQPRLADPVLPNAKRGEIYQQAAIRQMQLYKALLGSIAEI